MRLQLVKFFLFASIVVTCLAAVMAFFNYRYYLKSSEEIDGIHQFMLHSTEMLSLMKDGETGSRGYVLSDDTTYLQPYNSCVKGIQFYKVELQNHINKHDSLSPHLEEISRLIDNKMTIMRRTILTNDSLGQQAAIQLIKTNLGKNTMDSLRVEVRTLLAKEGAINKDISEKYQNGLYKMNVIRYCIQAFVILITFTAIITLTRKQKEIIHLLNDLKQANSTLEQKVEERTKQLHEANMELTAQNEEISAQADQIYSQNDELILLNEQKNKFLGIASHDMKSPLKRVDALLGLVKASPNATVASQKEFFDIIGNTVDGMQKLVGQLLDINKIEQGKHEIHLESFDLIKFSRNILSTFDSQAAQKNIQLLFESSFPEFSVKSDKMVLAQILENLISNALKFSSSNTSVRLEITSKEKAVALSIHDQGPGIKESELSLLFGKFQKLSNRPTAGESSSGLGLSIVKDLATSLGGSVDCQSEIGKGSTFSVRLPA